MYLRRGGAESGESLSLGGGVGDMSNRKEHLTSEGFDKILSIIAIIFE